ncbi:MAG: MoaD/ThiS family protein [Candidatus Njordarchaeia archaeon]
MVQVKFYGFLRDKFGIKAIKISNAITVREVFHILENRFGKEALKSIFDSIEDFVIKRNIIVLKNGKNVLNPNEPVNPNDEISIMPFLGGGEKGFMV